MQTIAGKRIMKAVKRIDIWEWLLTFLAVGVIIGSAFCFFPSMQRQTWPQGNFDAIEQSGPFNINEANARQLMLLPGIGEKKAETILEYRENCGGFSSLQEVAEVKGVSLDMVAQWDGFVYAEMTQ